MVGYSSWFEIVIYVAFLSGPLHIVVQIHMTRATGGHECRDVAEILPSAFLMVYVGGLLPAHLTGEVLVPQVLLSHFRILLV